jgi:GTP-binding protein Era
MLKPENQKLLSVCIIGKPNAGKSTLLNKIIGQKISIVTPKVQTTRSIITGIITLGETQLILFDTPGIFEAKKRLEKAMVKCAWSSLNGADIVVLILDSGAKIDEMMNTIISRLKELGKKVVFLLNKIDIKSKYYLDNLNYLTEKFPDSTKFNISALTGTGVDGFIECLKNNSRKTNWLYESDDITNLPMRFLASEITREQLFLNLHQELPYNLTVESESWQTQKNGSVKVNQVIIVSRDGYKNMIIGKKGEKIKEIGTKARLNIEELLGIKIHLFLFVKVRKSWEDNPELYHSMGLKF